MQNTKIKRVIVNLFIIFIVLVILFFVFEGFLRLFYPMHLEHTRFEPYLAYENIPNWEGYLRSPQFLKGEYLVKMKFNSYGLNDKEINVDNLSDRILIIGDSFVLGSGVSQDDSFPQVTEKLLNKYYGWDVEVINIGIGSYNLGGYLNYIKYKSDLFHPDLIVIGLFLGNDLGSTDLYNLEGNQLIEKTPFAEPSITMKTRRFLLRNSHTYSFVLSVVSNTLLGEILRAGGIFASYKLPVLDDRERYYPNQPLHEALIKQIKEETNKRNQKLLFVLIPFREQIDNSLYKETYPNGSKIGRFEFQKRASELLDRYDIPYLDPTTTYLRLNKDNTFYYNTDEHFNEKGHLLLGYLLAGYLKSGWDSQYF